MKRKLLLETLEKELPSGTIRHSSKLDSVEDLGNFKLLHLADGTSIKAKVILGIKCHPFFPFPYVILWFKLFWGLVNSDIPKRKKVVYMENHRKQFLLITNLILWFKCVDELKVLVGCDGVNSVVAKWLGFKKPAFATRSAVRGFADFKQSHGFQPKFLEYSGNNVKYGVLPCDDHTVYWFFTYTPTPQGTPIHSHHP